jgi:hypothetical protein
MKDEEGILLHKKVSFDIFRGEKIKLHIYNEVGSWCGEAIVCHRVDHPDLRTSETDIDYYYLELTHRQYHVIRQLIEAEDARVKEREDR